MLPMHIQDRYSPRDPYKSSVASIDWMTATTFIQKRDQEETNGEEGNTNLFLGGYHG